MNNGTFNRTLSPTVLAMNYVYQVDVLVMYSFLALMCVATMSFAFHYRSKQPIKSRFVLPYFGPAAILFMSLDRIVSSIILLVDPMTLRYTLKNATVAYQIMFYTDLVFSNIIALPLLQFAFFLYLYQTLFYFITRNMYEIIIKFNSIRGKSKRGVTSSSEVDLNKVLKNSIKQKLKLYKALTGRTLFAAVSVLFLFTCVMINIIVRMLPFVPEIASSFDHDASIEICMIFDMSLRGFLGTCLFLVFSWDLFIMNFSKIFKQCAWKQFFFGEDPFRFRIEFVMIFALMAFALMGQAFSLPATYATSGRQFDPMYFGLQLASEQPRFLYLVCVLLTCGGLVVLVKIKRDIKTWRIKSPGDGYLLMDTDSESTSNTNNLESELFDILIDPQGYDVFSEFSKLEWSLENLLAWSDLQRILRTYKMDGMSDERRLEMTTKLFNNYIDPDTSKFPINLRSEVLGVITNLVQQKITDHKHMKRTLKNLDNCLTENLADTYTRFVSTDAYKQYMAARTLQLQLNPKAEFRSESNKLVELDSIEARKYVK